MAKKVNFFQCFSINLHNFLKSSGIKHMNKEVHDSGINIGMPNGMWRSFSSLREAHNETGIDRKDLNDIHSQLVNSTDVGQVEMGEYKFSKRTRTFWVYISDEKLDRALRIWKETGPKSKEV